MIQTDAVLLESAAALRAQQQDAMGRAPAGGGAAAAKLPADPRLVLVAARWGGSPKLARRLVAVSRLEAVAVSWATAAN